MLPNAGGIVPVNRLLEKTSSARLVRLPNSAGISPVNRLGEGESGRQSPDSHL